MTTRHKSSSRGNRTLCMTDKEVGELFLPCQCSSLDLVCFFFFCFDPTMKVNVCGENTEQKHADSDTPPTRGMEPDVSVSVLHT